MSTQAVETNIQPEITPEPPARRRRRLLPLLIVLVFVAAALGVWELYFSRHEPPANVVTLSGRIEGGDSAVSPRTTGRILEIRYREGDTVKAGDVIAVLDDQQVRARGRTRRRRRYYRPRRAYIPHSRRLACSRSN